MTAQKRFIELLATKPYCSDFKGAHNIRTKKHALKKPYIQYNPPHMCAWLVFDCDHSNIFLFEDHRLPPPNWISVTPGTGRYHMAYAIVPVYTTGNAKPHPLRYLAALERTYGHFLRSDDGFNHLVTKNPLHSDWETLWLHNHVYTLGELQDGCQIACDKAFEGKLKPKDKLVLATGMGRNEDLFDYVRRWAYKSIRQEQYRDANQLHSAVYDITIDRNATFKAPLPHVEVKSIANSVSKWVWRKRIEIIERTHDDRKIGLNKDLPLKTKQSLGAMYSASVKKDATVAKIKAARAMLIKRGDKDTQKAVQAITHLGISTVKRYWNDTAKTG